MSGAAAVSFARVSKTYDGRIAVVDDLDLTVGEGEFLSLLGPSGSGKTTTLMMLAGFETPTAGEITLAGRSLAHVPAHRRDIGMVFQDYALFPHMSVADNLAYPLRLRGMAREEIRARVDKALAMINMSGFGQRLPAALSGGQRQRVAVARALIFAPRLVLMDEPLGALDRQLREQLQIEIKQLHRELGLTIVYVTHDQAEALTLSDRIALFHQGRIEQLGTPRDLYERPDTPFVANFLGDNNLIRCTVARSDGQDCQLRLPSGDLLAGKAAVGLTSGDKAVVAIRPEAIRPCANGQAATAEAEIIEAVYTGDQLRMRCRAFGIDNLQIKISSADMPAQAAAGTRLRFSIAPEAVRAMADS